MMRYPRRILPHSLGQPLRAGSAPIRIRVGYCNYLSGWVLKHHHLGSISMLDLDQSPVSKGRPFAQIARPGWDYETMLIF
jgi:hypothetical protein